MRIQKKIIKLFQISNNLGLGLFLKIFHSILDIELYITICKDYKQLYFIRDLMNFNNNKNVKFNDNR